MKDLDVHGVDDDGVYHPPSLARYQESLAYVAKLEARVTELQTLNTRLENERRKFKMLYEATHSLLTHALVDLPTYTRALGIGGEDAEMIAGKMSQSIDRVREANKRLVNDAWCGAANEARAFVKAVDATRQEFNDRGHDSELVTEWRARFDAITK